MRVGVIQSCYIPWRGYFDFIDGVDLFVIYDDVQYSKGGWRNRNQVKVSSGLKWLTVPVAVKLGMAVDETPIGRTNKPWQDTHRALLEESFQNSPFRSDAMAIWEGAVAQDYKTISALNIRLMQATTAYLGINTPFVMSRDYHLQGKKTERLIDLMRKLGATSYLSGPTARPYLNEDLFRSNRIRLEYKTYDYAEYPQPWGPFEGAVSVLDLIANTGARAKDYLRCRSPDVVAVP
jgi:WbqC-like protein family